MSSIKFMTLLFSNVALKAKEVVLDRLGGGYCSPFCFCTLLYKICRAIWKAAGGNHSGEFNGDTVSGAAEGVPCAGKSLNSFMHFVSLVVYFRTNP